MRTQTHTKIFLRTLRGFTAIELMIAIGIMAGAAGITIPMFRQFQSQADVDTATEHLVQALRAAQTLSQAGKLDSSWGVYFPDGTLFLGDQYSLRSEEYDEIFTIPQNVETSGMNETSFTKISGLPIVTGVVTVTSAITGNYRTITVESTGVIVVSGIKEPSGTGGSTGGTTGGVSGGTTGGTTGGETSGTSGGTTGGDTSGTTGGTTGGDTSGTTGGEASGTSGGVTGGDTGGTGGGSSSSSSASSVNSSANSSTGVSSTSSSFSSSVGNSSSQSSSSSSSGEEKCGLHSFFVRGNGCAISGQYPSAEYICHDGAEKEMDDGTCRNSADWMTVAQKFCDGRCEGDIRCEKRFSIDGHQGTIRSIGTNDVKLKILGSNSTYTNTKKKIAVRLAVNIGDSESWSDLFEGKSIEGNEEQILEEIDSATPIVIRVNGRYSWIFNKTFRSDEKDGHIIALRSGDPLPNYANLRNHGSLPSFLKKVVDKQGKVSIEADEVLYIVELNALDNNAKFQDVAMLAKFSSKAYSCVDENKGRFKVSFKRIQNTGDGNMKNKVFVGPHKEKFAEEQWIPLFNNNGVIVDNGMVENVNGLAIERGNGWIRIVNYGSHPAGSGKEIVDARILFSKAYINSMANDEQNESENPTDGIVNDNAGGDEFVPGPNAKSMTFNTRVTSADDGVILYWSLGEPSGASSSSSSSSSSSAVGEGDNCYVPYALNEVTKMIELASKSDVSIRIAGSEATYGEGGPRIGVSARISFDGGITWQNINEGKTLRGSEFAVFRDVPAGSKIALEYTGRYSWVFNRSSQSNVDRDRVQVLRNGETTQELRNAKLRGDMKKFLSDLVDSDARIAATDRDVVFLLNLSDNEIRRFQDAVAVVSIDKSRSSGGCTASSASSSSASSVASTSSSSSSAGNIDTDGDTILNEDDWCPFDTKVPESVPTEYMSFNRYALTGLRGKPTSLPVFRVGARKTVSNYSIADTHGCSCAQILDAIEDRGFHRFSDHPVVFRQLKNLFGFFLKNSRKFGCSESLIKMVKNAHENDIDQ